MNMLIPKGLAEVASPENRKKVAAKKAQQVASMAADDAAFAAAVQQLTSSPLTITAEANDQGHLFEAVKPEIIVDTAAANGITLTPTQITVEEPIKSVGEHSITLRSGEAQASVTVTVVAA